MFQPTNRPRLTRLDMISGVTSYLTLVGFVGVVVTMVIDAVIGPGPVSRPASPPPQRDALPPSRPIHLEIPKIGVNTSLAAFDKNAGQLPPAPSRTRETRAGWYWLGPNPGDRGGAVIVGHATTARGPAAFRRLRLLRQGDLVKVRRDDGRTAVFRIDSVERVRRNRFPTRKAYGALAYPGIRLVTSGGRADRTGGRHRDSVIAYGHLSQE